MPYPPSRPAYQAKPTSPIPISEADSRQRSGSTSSNRSLRRRPVILNDNPTLSRLSTLIESNNTKEIDELASPDIVGSFEAISKRSREGRTPKRRASEDTKYTTNVASQGGKPWYLLPQYRDQLNEDSKGNIRTGTLEALVERLTTDVGTTDPTKIAESKKFTSIFLMTFRTFTTANRLFDMLLDRFNIQPPKNLTDPERKDWKANLCLPVQRRVLDVLTVWLEDHRLLEEEPYISKHLTEFLNAIDGPPLYLTATAILKSLERLTFTVPSSSTTTSPKKSRKSKAHKNDLLKIDPSDVAEQLTVLESSLYMKITPQECLTYAKTQSGGAVAKLSDFIGTHDKLGAWVKLSVLNLDTLVKRAETVDFWIKVAEKCRVLNNFASMSSIIIALSSVVISRLHVTWGHVGRKSQLDVLLRYNEPTGGFAGYRQLLNTAEGPCVPFITMFLTDIIHAYEQFDSQEGGQIYFFQRARWHEIITKMLKFQSRPYCLPASESTMNFIEGHLRDGNQRDQNWYWNRSQELQHSELAHADIRKGLEAAGF
ncbi:hypothetical protein NLJ89_g7311 [Agrocybe chaxingu]|uniref:Uncharacterized protein n=1 Tax=Agrocybe chaxingu TaxID=84603 RepID=A0A9W8JXL8_9AGAR|nr:hypothetical protein NLJ89_g7311 [Agrocybe chaxingu]